MLMTVITVHRCMIYNILYECASSKYSTHITPSDLHTALTNIEWVIFNYPHSTTSNAGTTSESNF